MKTCDDSHGPSERGPDVWFTHFPLSDYQRRANPVRVLLPGELEPGRSYPVVYVLPVGAGPDEERDRWGDGPDALLEPDNLAARFGLICVFPVFDTIPWFADNDQDPSVRQESYLLKVVIPLVEEQYPVVRSPRGRLLLGFSKSGFGALSLLLRHPTLFGRAAAWDAPLMMDRPEQYGADRVFGAGANFERYAIPGLLKSFKAGGMEDEDPKRLILMGWGGFREDMERAHALMQELGIPHVYRDGPERAHHWRSGWVPEAIALLVS